MTSAYISVPWMTMTMKLMINDITKGETIKWRCIPNLSQYILATAMFSCSCFTVFHVFTRPFCPMVDRSDTRWIHTQSSEVLSVITDWKELSPVCVNVCMYMGTVNPGLLFSVDLCFCTTAVHLGRLVMFLRVSGLYRHSDGHHWWPCLHIRLPDWPQRPGDGHYLCSPRWVQLLYLLRFLQIKPVEPLSLIQLTSEQYFFTLVQEVTRMKSNNIRNTSYLYIKMLSNNITRRDERQCLLMKRMRFHFDARQSWYILINKVIVHNDQGPTPAFIVNHTEYKIMLFEIVFEVCVGTDLKHNKDSRCKHNEIRYNRAVLL